jgi:Fe-S oxidoreductase
MENNTVLTENSFHFDFLNVLAGEKAGNEKLKTCIQCGSCTGSCVAADGMSISPRRLWRSAQMGMDSAVMESMSYWNCTTCGLCDKRCPRGIPLSQIMLSLREKYDKGGGVISGVSQTIENLQKSGNITGDDPQNRFLWLDNLALSEEDRAKLFKKQSEAVYFTGCVGALFPQVGGIPQSLTKLLLRLGADFSLLDDERCCGYPVMAGGKGAGGVAEYALHNISQIEGKGAKTVIVTCPTCYYMFTKVYPGLYEKPLPFQVSHYAEYLAGVDGITCGGKDTTVTYHDPCDLGRKLHITEAPRTLLAGLSGVEFREMRFSGEDSKCCGGGGNLEMANAELSGDIAAKRVNDALETGAEYLLSSCQQCKRTLQNAARKTRARIKVLDLLEFLLMRFDEAEKEAAK